MTAWIESFLLMAASVGAAVSILVIGTCVKAIITREWL